MRRILFLACLLAAAPASAQTPSTYVGASGLGEFARFGGVDYDEDEVRIAQTFERSGDADTIGFALALGRAVGERWGVEFEFARGGTGGQRITERVTPRVIDLPAIFPPPFPIPDFAFELRTSQQHTTVSTLVWVRQELGTRTNLVFSGGASFNHSEMEQEFDITDHRLALFLPYPREVESTQNGVGPVVGAAVAVEIAEHVALTGGIRLHGIHATASGGWLVRPSVGLRWTF